jgi:enoyl reductase-like protein
MGFFPIHEVIEDRNTRIKVFYWKLWFGDESILPSLDIRDTFTGPEVTIDVASVEKFCGVVGNEGDQVGEDYRRESSNGLCNRDWLASKSMLSIIGLS